MGRKQTAYLFMGMLFTWPLLRTSATGTLLLAASASIPWSLDCYYLFIAADFVFALIGIVAAPSLRHLIAKSHAVLVAGGGALLCNGLITLMEAAGHLHPLVLTFGTLGFALSIPVLLLAWAAKAVNLMSIGYRRSALCLCGSFAASFIFGMVQYLPAPAPFILPLFCPLASAILYALADAPPSEPSPEIEKLSRGTILRRLPWGTLALFVVTMLLGCLLVGIFRSGSITRLDAPIDIARDSVTAMLACLIFLMLTRLGRGPRTFRVIWVVIFAILSFGPLLIMISYSTPSALLGIAASSASRACLSFLLFFYLASITTERQLPTIFVFSTVFLSSNALSDMLSFALVPVISSALGTDYPALLQPVAFAVSVITFALFVGFSGKMALSGTARVPDGQPTNDGNLPEASSHSASIKHLLNEAGITEREQEVLQLIAEGNSYRATAQQLHITEGTVQSHIKRIYGKLNVHSRQELIDLLRP